MHHKLVLATVMCALGLTGMAGCAPGVTPTPTSPAPARPAASQNQPAAAAAQAATSEGLPDGPGKAETLAACSGCHGIGQIIGQHRDAAQWSSTVTAMINNGAPVTDADFGKVVGYLAAHFGP